MAAASVIRVDGKGPVGVGSRRVPIDQPAPTFRFGRFTLDCAARQVIADGAPVHLTPKAFDLLALLVKEAPRVVTKAELHSHLWPDSFVSDASLLGLVKEVRRALNDEGDGTLIRTAHRVGYAFAAPLDPGPSAAKPSTAWVMVGDVCVPLTEGENLIGRDAACAVRVDLLGISRRHARIVVSGLNATIDDLGSKNGTMLDGEPVARVTALREGDQVQVGGVIVRFHFSATTPPKETVPTGGDRATKRRTKRAEADIVH